MESEQQVSRAKGVLHHYLGLYWKRGSRIHDQAAEENAQRLRALEDLCGQCTNLELKFRRMDGKSVVKLRCNKGYDPLELYEKTPLGKPASCPGFTQK